MITMEIPVEGPETWTSIDEQRLADFLNTETGKRVVPRLMEACPELLPNGDTNAILVRNGEVRGMTLALHTLNIMAHPVKFVMPKVGNEFPHLEDDAAWSDGKKLNDKEADPLA
jgi:hypothetical protein